MSDDCDYYSLHGADEEHKRQLYFFSSFCFEKILFIQVMRRDMRIAAISRELWCVHANHKSTRFKIAGFQFHVNFQHFQMGEDNGMRASVYDCFGHLRFALQHQHHTQIVLEYRLGRIQRIDVPIGRTAVNEIVLFQFRYEFRLQVVARFAASIQHNQRFGAVQMRQHSGNGRKKLQWSNGFLRRGQRRPQLTHMHPVDLGCAPILRRTSMPAGIRRDKFERSCRRRGRHTLAD